MPSSDSPKETLKPNKHVHIELILRSSSNADLRDCWNMSNRYKLVPEFLKPLHIN